MIEKKLIRKCPICDNLNGQIIHNQSFVVLKGSPLTENYDLVSCSGCGFVFADTSSTQDDYNSYYSILSKYEDSNVSSGSAFNQNDYDRLLRTANIIEKYAKKNDSILDLGCANGGQLKVLKDRGFSNLMGVDPSKVCVGNVISAGIDAFQAHFFDQSFIIWDKKFDFIILSHVLEHIKDLDMAIQIAKSKLTTKGILYIEVPDASRYDKFFVIPYYFIDCEHINHFSKKSLDNLLSKYGLKNIHSDQDQIKLNANIDYPIFNSLFSKTKEKVAKIDYDATVLESFKIFINQSIERDNSAKIIKQLVDSQEDIIIWGVGQFTLRLLGTTDLSKSNIIGFVDSDRSKHAKKINGINIYPPDFIVNKECTLLVCSALYANDILDVVKQLNSNIKYYIFN